MVRFDTFWDTYLRLLQVFQVTQNPGPVVNVGIDEGAFTWHRNRNRFVPLLVGFNVLRGVNNGQLVPGALVGEQGLFPYVQQRTESGSSHTRDIDKREYQEDRDEDQEWEDDGEDLNIRVYADFTPPQSDSEDVVE